MKTKHTPGPWKVRDSVLVENDCGRTVADCALDDNDEVTLRRGLANAANARLIAAAPELLLAAEKTLAFIDDLANSNPGFMARLVVQDYAQWNEAMIELPRAINKARGVSNA